MDFLRDNGVIINAKEGRITYNNNKEPLPVPLVGSMTVEENNWFNLVNVPEEHRNTMKTFLLNHYSLFADKMTGLAQIKNTGSFCPAFLALSLLTPRGILDCTASCG